MLEIQLCGSEHSRIQQKKVVSSLLFYWFSHFVRVLFTMNSTNTLSHSQEDLKINLKQTSDFFAISLRYGVWKEALAFNNEQKR